MALGLRRRKLGLPYVRGVELHWVANGVRSESERDSQLGLAEFACIGEDEAGGLAEVGPVRPMREHVPAQEGLGVYAAVPDHLVRGRARREYTAGCRKLHGGDSARSLGHGQGDQLTVSREVRVRLQGDWHGR